MITKPEFRHCVPPESRVTKWLSCGDGTGQSAVGGYRISAKSPIPASGVGGRRRSSRKHPRTQQDPCVSWTFRRRANAGNRRGRDRTTTDVSRERSTIGRDRHSGTTGRARLRSVHDAAQRTQRVLPPAPSSFRAARSIRDFSPQTAARTVGFEPDASRRSSARASPTNLPHRSAVDGEAAAAIFAAALRELFEESGILLARTASARRSAAAEIFVARRARARSAIGGGALSFAAFLERRDWFADARALTLFSHWITPPNEPRRYNTHFFFALAPAEQTGIGRCGRNARRNLDRSRRRARPLSCGTFRLVYPTIKHLERLAPFAVTRPASARSQTTKPIFTILPATGSGAIRDAADAGKRMVTLVRAPNPSALTLDGTNSYVIVAAGDEALVVDPGSADRAHVQALLETAANAD